MTEFHFKNGFWRLKTIFGENVGSFVAKNVFALLFFVLFYLAFDIDSFLYCTSIYFPICDVLTCILNF